MIKAATGKTYNQEPKQRHKGPTFRTSTEVKLLLQHKVKLELVSNVNLNLMKPEKTANISRCHHKFHGEMTSEAEIPYWWRVTTQISVVLIRISKISLWNICTRFSDVIWRGNQWWRREISAVFSGQTWGQTPIPVQRQESWVTLIGSLSNDDGVVNENGIKAVGLDWQTTTLHVHHAFLYIFLSLGCTTTTWNSLILRFVEDGNTRQQFSFPELWCSP